MKDNAQGNEERFTAGGITISLAGAPPGTSVTYTGAHGERLLVRVPEQRLGVSQEMQGARTRNEVVEKHDSALTVSEWADRYRKTNSCAWKTRDTPYLAEIMDSLGQDSPIERVVFMKASQMGGTECGNNWIGYSIHQRKGPFLAVQPTVQRATDYAGSLAAELGVTAAARRACTPSNANFFVFGGDGGVLNIVGATSAASIVSNAGRHLFMDEVDEYPSDVGGKGDPAKLALARTVLCFPNPKVFLTSTPRFGAEESRIATAFEESDKRYFVVPCPSCEELQGLRFNRLNLANGKAWYNCESCGFNIPEENKLWMLSRGYWRRTARGDGKTAGFQISNLYSPWFRWTDIAAHFETAKKKGSEAMRTFKHMVLGEPA